MMIHPRISILAIASEHQPVLRSFFSYLHSISHIQLSFNAEIPTDLSAYDVVITADTAGFNESCAHLEHFVSAGGGWLELVQVSDKPLPEILGLKPVRSDQRLNCVSCLSIRIMGWPNDCRMLYI